MPGTSCALAMAAPAAPRRKVEKMGATFMVLRIVILASDYSDGLLTVCRSWLGILLQHEEESAKIESTTDNDVGNNRNSYVASQCHRHLLLFFLLLLGAHGDSLDSDS